MPPRRDLLGPSSDWHQRLPAVTAGHVYGSIYFLPSGYSDALGALDALDEALAKLASKA